MSADSSGPITIDVWLNLWPLWPELIDPVREQAAEFGRRHPGYRVDVTGIPYPTMPVEVAKAAAADRPPALAAYQYTVTQDARDAVTRSGHPLFVPIERAIGGRAEILGEPVVTGDLLANARGYYTFGGELAAMPRNTSTTVMVVNTSLLEAVGLTGIPRTWCEIEQAAEAIAAARGGPAITWPNFGWFFQQAVGQQGGLLADRGNGRDGRADRVDLASPEMLAFVDWWRRLHERGHYLYTGTPMDWPGCHEAFVAQQVAFMFTSSVEIERTVQAGREAGFDVAAAPLPHRDDVPYQGQQVAGEAFWLADGLDQATTDGALAFLQYVTNARHATSRHGHGRSFVATTGASIALLEAEGWYDEHPQTRVPIELLRASADTPATRAAVFGGFMPIQMLTAEAMHDVLTEGVDPRARFTRATAQAQRLLDEYNRKATGVQRAA